MKKLTSQEIEKIKDWMQKSGLTDPTLKQELIDHISCDLEQDMKAGNSFDNAFNSFIKAVSKEEILRNEQRKLRLRLELKKLRHSNRDILFNIIYMAGGWFAINPNTVSNRGETIYGGVCFILWIYSMTKMMLNQQKRKELLRDFELGK